MSIVIPRTELTVVDKPAARQLPERKQPVEAVVVHSTGSTDLGKILAWYTDRQGLQPHYCISYDGTIYRIVQEDHVAWHCRIEAGEAAVYEKGYAIWSRCAWSDRSGVAVDTGAELARYAEWRDRWQPLGKQSPLDLVTGAVPNSVTVGIELQQPERPYPGPDIFTDAQYSALCELVADIAERCVISLDRQSLLGHYDISPMRRSNASGSWDPGKDFNWERVFSELGVDVNPAPPPLSAA